MEVGGAGERSGGQRSCHPSKYPQVWPIVIAESEIQAPEKMPETGAIQLRMRGRKSGEGGFCHLQLSLPSLGQRGGGLGGGKGHTHLGLG